MNLYLVPVPIGNLRDITLRAVDVLKAVDFIVTEDTRYSGKLLSHLNIKKPLMSYYKPREKEKSAAILKRLEKENGALITDSGTPVVSDPGYLLVYGALESGVQVIPLPGPTAFVPALAASGIKSDRFAFLGFPPRKKGECRRFLQDYSHFAGALVFYESPRRVRDFLLLAAEELGNRDFALAKELSKKHEKIIRGKLEYAAETLENEVILGEMVVVIAPGEQVMPVSSMPEFSCRQDIFDYFKKKYRISANTVKKAWMSK